MVICKTSVIRCAYKTKYNTGGGGWPSVAINMIHIRQYNPRSIASMVVLIDLGDIDNQLLLVFTIRLMYTNIMFYAYVTSSENCLHAVGLY